MPSRRSTSLPSTSIPSRARRAAARISQTCIENIDIGGPALIRAGAKNHASVTVVVDPADYYRVLAEMEKNGGATTPELRKELAAKAFARTGAYDAAIGAWFAETIGDRTPAWRVVAGTLADALRYGENPHQWGAFYRTSDTRFGVATATLAQGKELSYNNLNDADAAYELVAEFDPGAPPRLPSSSTPILAALRSPPRSKRPMRKLSLAIRKARLAA